MKTSAFKTIETVVQQVLKEATAKQSIKLYVVRNKNGEYYTAYDGGKAFSPLLQNAKLFKSVQKARSVLSFTDAKSAKVIELQLTELQ